MSKKVIQGIAQEQFFYDVLVKTRDETLLLEEVHSELKRCFGAVPNLTIALRHFEEDSAGHWFTIRLTGSPTLLQQLSDWWAKENDLTSDEMREVQESLADASFIWRVVQ